MIFSQKGFEPQTQDMHRKSCGTQHIKNIVVTVVQGMGGGGEGLVG